MTRQRGLRKTAGGPKVRLAALVITSYSIHYTKLYEVVTVERLESLSRAAQATLAALGMDNIRFRTGDGTLGAPDDAPFDRVIVTAAARNNFV